ncbi:YusW family protein [uncultured Enterococcus sp.]|uniref:YusW family protein n=1 Tax=uncultured Enterococcus sp. TaxID=167972 RepID=UPI002AA7608C|nr:YusW family protein [uncultured Enterococcus sp.]
MKKLTLGTAVLLTALSLSAAIIPAATAQAAITVESSEYKSVTLFSVEEMEAFTGESLTSKTVSSFYKKLTTDSTWTAAGYTEKEAKSITLDFTRNQSKAEGILKKLNKNSALYLKIIILKQHSEGAAFGVQGYDSNNQTPEPSTPAETQGTLKELDISIEYKKGDIELSYEVKSNGKVKAEYENELTNTELSGTKAQTTIEALLEKIDFKTMDNTQITQVVLKELNLSDNYKEFEFEAEFSNNTKVEFKNK